MVTQLAENPPILASGWVTHRLLLTVTDREDPDQEPDILAVQGNVLFRANVEYIQTRDSEGNPVTVLKGPIEGVYDNDGFLCTPDPITKVPMYRGVKLGASDDPNSSVTGFSWTAQFNLKTINGTSLKIPSTTFLVFMGTTKDLTEVVSVPATPGYGLPQAEAAALRAEQQALEAKNYAMNSAQSSQESETAATNSAQSAAEANLAVSEMLAVNDTAISEVLTDPESISAQYLSDNFIGNDEFPASMAEQISDTSSPARILLGSTFVAKGELIVNALDYGAVPSPTVDQSQALNAAAQAARAIGINAKLKIPHGNYRIDSTVVFLGSLDASEATFTYYGSGIGVILGSDQVGVVTARQSFRAPRVIKAGRVSKWDGTTIGIQANNLNTCEVYVPFVQDFEYGFYAYGNSGGNAYNNYHLGALWENHKNLVLGCTPDGYTNQNLFIGGRLQHSTTKGATIDDMDASQIFMVSQNAEGGPNNNTFLNTSFEGENVAYYRLDIGGSYNQFLNCRWETLNGNPRVRYRSSALRNKIDGGYNAHNIVEVFEGTLGGGEIRDTQGAYVNVTATTAQVIPNSLWTTITTWATTPGRRISYNSATGEFTPRPGRWLISATVTFAPKASGRRIARMMAGGSTSDIAESPGTAGSTERITLKLMAVASFDGVKTVKVECNQSSGADLALEATSPYVKFSAEYLGY